VSPSIVIGHGERVPLAHVRSGVGASYSEVGEQLGDALGGHRRAPIGVDGDRSLLDALGSDCCGDELCGLGGSDHPADDVAGET